MFKILSNSRKIFPVFCQTRGAKCCKPCPVYQCPRKPKEEDFIYVIQHPVNEKPKHYNASFYQKIFYFISAPLILGYGYYLFYALDHDKRRVKFLPFDYLRIRKKPLHFHENTEKTLFHHHYYNPLPGGYEYEVPPEEEIDPDELLKGRRL